MEVIPTINQAIWSILAFLLLFVLLSRFVFPSIVKILEEREKRIDESLRKAEETREEAERLMTEYKKQLEEAKREAQAIVEQGRKLGESAKEEMIRKAQEEAQKIVEKAQAEIIREKEKAFKELQQKTGDLALDIASRLLAKNITSEDNKRLIEETLKQVKSLNEN